MIFGQANPEFITMVFSAASKKGESPQQVLAELASEIHGHLVAPSKKFMLVCMRGSGLALKQFWSRLSGQLALRPDKPAGSRRAVVIEPAEQGKTDFELSALPVAGRANPLVSQDHAVTHPRRHHLKTADVRGGQLGLPWPDQEARDPAAYDQWLAGVGLAPVLEVAERAAEYASVSTTASGQDTDQAKSG